MKQWSSGKVRDIYEVDEKTLLIIVSDRISAFDFNMPDPVPGKGALLNKLSEFWFDFIEDIAPSHLITTDYKQFPPAFQGEEFRDRGMLVRKLKILPVECIVRGYITGSGWADYRKTGTICGLKLPAGLQESQKLDEPAFTPSTKAEMGEHDENISYEAMCGILGGELGQRVRDASIAIYQKCADYALDKGIIIADTKFEFGLDESGNLVLADEVLTPDSSRFWALDSYQVGRGQKSFDKQYLRDWLSENGYRDGPPEHLPEDVIKVTADKYREAYERITGKSI